MQLLITKKKQCDAKALTIVEQLLEPNIDVQWLLYNLRYINKCHMEDVIEERAVIKLCGYVLCSNALTMVINQQYHISTRRNKVYDITRRKNFCSSQCYGACNYLLEQILTSPLWLRDKEEIPDFKVLPAKDVLQRSTPGDEICVMDTTAILNPNNTSKDEIHVTNTITELNSNNEDRPADSNKELKNSEHIEIRKIQSKCSIINTDNQYNIMDNNDLNSKPREITNSKTLDSIKDKFLIPSVKTVDQFKDKSINIKHTFTDVKECDNVSKESDNITKQKSVLQNAVALDNIKIQDEQRLHKEIIFSSEDKDQNEKNEEQNKLFKTLEIVCNSTAVTKENTVINDKNNVEKVEKTKSKTHKQKDHIKEKQSTKFHNLTMHIENNIKEWINEDTISLLSGEEEIRNKLLDNITQHDRYLHLCKKLNKLQLEDEKDDTDLTKSSLKPMPHLSVLREEGKKIELKVKAFFKGDMVVETLEQTAETMEQNDDFTAVLPLTDVHAPKALRRRIFMDKLNRILPDLLRALAGSGLSQYTYSNERAVLIKVLVNTFSLSAKNIIFKTAEWTLVGLIIIKMLSMIDPQLKNLLLTRQATMYISMILMSYKLDSNYLDRLVMELINDAKIACASNIKTY
ncbi:putative RNA polymerase II subunit B1 CTD phosphatase RPAP2 isoform X2 [Nomia melanderi]|nr:putative RNA polymerase II subunit B1 CTD phosphatase Rpap2 isoform X2 [Nomia melanderi]